MYYCYLMEQDVLYAKLLLTGLLLVATSLSAWGSDGYDSDGPPRKRRKTDAPPLSLAAKAAAAYNNSAKPPTVVARPKPLKPNAKFISVLNSASDASTPLQTPVPIKAGAFRNFEDHSSRLDPGKVANFFLDAYLKKYRPYLVQNPDTNCRYTRALSIVPFDENTLRKLREDNSPSIANMVIAYCIRAYDPIYEKRDDGSTAVTLILPYDPRMITSYQDKSPT